MSEIPNPKPWTVRPVDEERVESLRRASALPRPLARLLALRGLEPHEIESFLNPTLSGLSDPFLLPDMERATARIWLALDHEEAITVFGDYDVDGVTSSALMVQVLRALGGRVTAFIPDRLDEGYGMTSDAVRRCMEELNPNLIISVDCGVNSIESVTHAADCGVDVIVTDHHQPAAETAPALAVINPNLGSDPMLKRLSGVGVAFKVLHAVLKRGRESGRTCAETVDLRDGLDLVAFGTVADMVPLTGENRLLVRYGLERMNNTNRKGLRALMDVAGVRGDVDAGHVGFQLGPRINAAGRIGQPMMALQLLLTEDAGEARRIAQRLDKTNTERQRIEREMVREALNEIEGYFSPTEHFGLTVAGSKWHPGVVGIVASRIARRYNRPTIVMGIEPDGSARGSCRSIEAFDMLAGLASCEAHLVKYGGHRMAAGLNVRSGALDVFREAFNSAAREQLETQDLTPVQPVDAVLQAEEIDDDFFALMRKLEPFGQDHPRPIWALMNARVVGEPRVVGKKHLKFSVQAEGRRFEAIAFELSRDQLPEGPIDLAFVLKENHWNGRVTLQLQIQSVRSAEQSE